MLLRDIYLGSGWLSVAAWIGTLAIVGTVATVVVAALDMRVPRIGRTGAKR